VLAPGSASLLHLQAQAAVREVCSASVAAHVGTPTWLESSGEVGGQDRDPVDADITEGMNKGVAMLVVEAMVKKEAWSIQPG